MRRIKWDEKTKQKVRDLRQDNLSIDTISKSVGVPRSTLFQWVRDSRMTPIRTSEEKLSHLRSIRPLATLAIKRKREERIAAIQEKINEEIKLYDYNRPELLQSMLSMLYWAEGSKGRGTLDFANTSPDLALLYITLLRKCYKIDESKFHLRIHLHPYHDVEKTRLFWSNLLKIPLKQIGKIYIKKRSGTKKFRENFAGICFIRYYSENLRYEVLHKGYSIGKMITGYSPL